ncbi:putative nucleoredoxin-like protein 2 [Apostichopus japonicus]|uniref:Putative nucleoredoxin-like protein 2 n=1 Tax=Stichopus japonicus TaxID=307972 RepID=A0A2G8L0C4_STIJA|nr:putative nucleoredoxin-like protein 2 [Apostichopus japonicus]
MKPSLTEIGRTAQIRMNIFEGKTLWRLTEEQESPVDVKETLKDKVVGLYFTAKWSPPCQEFMPLLCEVYQQLIERKLPFEIVHISCDKDQVEMKETLQKFRVCWPYLGFADKHTSDLVEQFNIIAVPKLIILSPDGEVISETGRKEVADRGIVCFKFWQCAAKID